jgi:hypothetical protein
MSYESSCLAGVLSTLFRPAAGCSRREWRIVNAARQIGPAIALWHGMRYCEMEFIAPALKII